MQLLFLSSGPSALGSGAGLDFFNSHNVCAAGAPLELVQPDILRFKAFEPVLLLGRNRLKNLDIRLRVKGGGHVSQIYGRGRTRGRAGAMSHPISLCS